MTHFYIAYKKVFEFLKKIELSRSVSWVKRAIRLEFLINRFLIKKNVYCGRMANSITQIFVLVITVSKSSVGLTLAFKDTLQVFNDLKKQVKKCMKQCCLICKSLYSTVFS